MYPKLCADWGIGAVASMVVRFAPPGSEYVVLWRILTIAYPLFAVPYKVCRPRSRSDMWRTLILQRALSVMTRYRPGFDLKLNVLGGDNVDRALRAAEPLVVCTAHFGLTLAAPRALADREHKVALIASQSSGRDGWHWGLRDPLHLLPSGSDTLLRARSVLRAGTPVICYVDYMLSGSDSQTRLTGISPSVFHLAYRLGANLLFLASRLESDGTITIEFHRPNQQRLATSQAADLCAEEFASFVADRTGWPCIVRRPDGQHRGAAARL
jgi:lauroyl/myristoyl acyltransferase